MKAEALAKFPITTTNMSETFCLKVNFDQTEVSEDVIELLSKHLKEDLDRDVRKVSLKESLALAAKGTHLQKGPANDLLYCILRALTVTIPESDESEDEQESDNSLLRFTSKREVEFKIRILIKF